MRNIVSDPFTTPVAKKLAARFFLSGALKPQFTFARSGILKAEIAVTRKRGVGEDDQKEPMIVPDPWVEFRIDNAYVPEPAQILMELHGKDVLKGKIIDVSDSGTQEDAFAVVSVEGLSQPVVVAIKNVKEIRRE